MFQATMSPKVLNAEKLEKKFASLTKSRESILDLSKWIIRHKEFYKEIVVQWLDALSKDMNALTMFYVANDVIQNCGRKKAPEFREAFSTVLERAVSLESVKEIKSEVIRMITLWHERSIYDAAFYKKLQDKLNDVEESESEEELDEVDIISNFKLEKLTDSLQKLKSLEEELLEKEEFLEDIEEPGVKNIDNLIVKMDSQKELRKVDKFQKLVESYLSLADKVLTAQKEAVLNLKYSNIFYSAQLEDAKKVAHAYRIYGKKVKIVEKGMVEKLVNLPEASPVLLEENSPNIEMNSSLEFLSPGLSTASDANNENTASNQSSSLDLSTSPTKSESGSFMNVNSLNEKYKSPIAESHDSVSTLSKSLNNTKKGVKNPTVLDVPNIVKEKEKKILKSPMAVESVVESASEDIENTLKSPLVDTILKKSDKILKSPIIVDVHNSQTTIDTSKNLNCEKISESPLIIEKVRKTTTDKKSKSPVAVETVRRISTDKVSQCVTAASLEVTFDKDKTTSGDISNSINSDLGEKTLKSSSSDSKSLAKKVCSSENEEISSTSKESKKTSEPDLQTLSDIENIDFLLEKSYNEQRTKSKGSFKRKIDNLLKMKQSKACKLSSNDNLKKTKTSVSKTSVEGDSAIVSCSNLDDGGKNDVSESFMTKEENIVISESLDNDEKIDTTSSLEETNNTKVDQSLEMTQNSKTSDSGTASENIPLPTSVSFSNFPDIPTELLKNILDKHRTNMNKSSSNTDSYCDTNDRPVVPDLKNENMKQTDSNQNSVNNNSIMNDKKDTSPGSGFAPVLDFETSNKTNNTSEKSVLDNANSISIIKDGCKTDTENITKNHCTVKATPLMENLQKLLKCFTEKGPALEELKNSKTLKTLPTYSLKSTLKLYHVLKEHHQKDDVLNSSSVNNNSLPDFSLESASSVNNKSSVCNYNSTNAFAHSKNDNLEIMDMEVDSDDDDTK